MDRTQSSQFEKRASDAAQSSLIPDVARFLWQTKKWWMIPILLTLLIVGALIILTSTAAAPFIYTLF